MTLVGGPRRCTIPISGAKLLKTGQTTSYADGDDGDIQAGRDVDFFTLAVNNPFGNTSRFTGIAGGYSADPLNTASPDFRTVDGSASTQAGAFPELIAIDWSTYDGNTVLGYDLNPLSFDTWDNARIACAAYSTATYPSGWRMPNRYELENVTNHGALGFGRKYAPFLLLSNTNSWCSTTYAAITSQAHLWFTSGAWSTAAKTNTRGYSPVREFTVTGTTLT